MIMIGTFLDNKERKMRLDGTPVEQLNYHRLPYHISYVLLCSRICAGVVAINTAII